jgi:hypothetical protein
MHNPATTHSPPAAVRSRGVAPSPDRVAPTPAFEVTIGERAGGAVVRIAGEATVREANTLEARLLPLVARWPQRVTFDLGELRFLSALALGVLTAFCPGGRPRRRRSAVRAGAPAPGARRARRGRSDPTARARGGGGRPASTRPQVMGLGRRGGRENSRWTIIARVGRDCGVVGCGWSVGRGDARKSGDLGDLGDLGRVRLNPTAPSPSGPSVRRRFGFVASGARPMEGCHARPYAG